MDGNEYEINDIVEENTEWVTNGNTRTRINSKKTILSKSEVTETILETGCHEIPVAPGEAKWRAPNLREFSLMVVFDLIEQKDVCRTRMGYDNYRKGWFYEGYISMNQNTYDQGDHIRCVRDVQ